MYVFMQIRELVNYLAQGRSDEEKASFSQPFEDALATAEGQKPFEEDEGRRRAVFEKIVPEVKGLGQGSERGMSLPQFDRSHSLSGLCRDRRVLQPILCTLLEPASS